MHHSRLQLPLQPMAKAMSTAKASGAPSVIAPRWHPELSSVGWEVMTEPGLEHAAPPKRSRSPEESMLAEMAVVKDEEKEQLLMAKIAILQRELDQMRKNNNV